MRVDAHVLAVGAQYGGHVRQIEFALRVFGLHAFESGEEEPRLETVDADVDLVDLPLFGRGVLLLDDLLEAPFVVAYDATVAGRVFEADGHQRACRAATAVRSVLVYERAEGLCAHERHVAGED